MQPANLMGQIKMKKLCLKLLSMVFSFSGSLVLMIALAALSFAYDKMQIMPYTHEVNGMVWQAGSHKFKPQVKKLPSDPEESPEVERRLLTIYDAENKAVFNKQLYIDWDMFGGGFVKAMQADSDPELEIVFYVMSSYSFTKQKQDYGNELGGDNHPIYSSFYLDINQQTGKIAAKDFKTEASAEAWQLAKNIFSALNPLLLVMFVLFGAPLIAIVLGLLGWLGRYIVSRNKQPKT